MMSLVLSGGNVIEGVVVTQLKQFSDERGSVMHMLRCDAPDFTHFGECYFSEVLPGAVKAWKRHRLQTQNLAVPVGKVRIVIYQEPIPPLKLGTLQVMELGRPDAYLRLRIPPGLWYGFTCIGSTPALVSNCPDLPHSPDESQVLNFDNQAIPYSWE